MNVTTKILDDNEMRRLGFTDHSKEHWYYTDGVGPSTSFNLTIDKKTGHYETLVMNEMFGQPEYYMSGLPHFRDPIIAQVDSILAALAEFGFTIAFDHNEYRIS